MDPFTHALASVALARTRRGILPRFGTAMLVVGGMAPDLDYASYFAGAGAFLRFHRTFFHSIPGAAVMTCVVAGAFCFLDKKWKRRTSRKLPTAPLTFILALAVCAIGSAGHILLDLSSGEGLQLLWPFRLRWSAWSLAANFDPWVLVLLIAGLLIPQLFRLVSEEIGARKKRASGTGAVITLSLLVAYFGVRAELHSRAVDLLLSSEYHGREPLAAGAFPSSADPFDWRGIVSTGNTIEEIGVPLGPRADFNSDRSLTHYKPGESPALDAAEKTAGVQLFLKYAQFPFATVNRREAGYRFDLRDARFPPDDANPASIVIRVDLDGSLRIAHEEFKYAFSANP